MLFSKLTYLKESGYRGKLTNFFGGKGGHLNKLGIWVKDIKVLYSLRHSGITAMERAGLPNLARTQLTGHSETEDEGEESYIGERTAHELLAELSKVDWAEALVNVAGSRA